MSVSSCQVPCGGPLTTATRFRDDTAEQLEERVIKTAADAMVMGVGRVNGDLVGRVHNSRYTVPPAKRLVGKTQAGERLHVGLVKIQASHNSQIQGIKVKLQPVGITQGEGYGGAHVGYPHLCQDRAVKIFNHTVHDALRMDENLDPFGWYIKDPFCLDDLKALIHHRG